MLSGRAKIVIGLGIVGVVGGGLYALQRFARGTPPYNVYGIDGNFVAGPYLTLEPAIAQAEYPQNVAGPAGATHKGYYITDSTGRIVRRVLFAS